jgi:hypothetical protein
MRVGGTVLNPPEMHCEVDEAIIYADGVPVMYVLEMEGKVFIKSVNDPDFNDMLEMAGIDTQSLPDSEVIKIPTE